MRYQRGSHLVEFGIVATALFGLSTVAIDTLIIASRRNLVRHELQKIALEYHTDPSLQKDFWSETGTYGTFKDKRETVARSFQSRLANNGSITLVPIEHTDPHDSTTSSVTLPLGYFPPGTSGRVVAWDSAPINNSHKCLTSTASGVILNPGVQGTPGPISGGGGGSGSSGLDRYKGIIGTKSVCQTGSIIDIHRPEDSLTKLSQQYPTEITAAFETQSILFGKVAMAVTVPFYPRPNTYVAPQTCQPNWSTVSTSGWSPACGLTNRTLSQEDGCANTRTKSESSCISCNFTRTGTKTACSTASTGGWGTSSCGEQDECGNTRNVEEKCCTPTWQNQGTPSCSNDTRVVMQTNPCDGKTRTVPHNDGGTCGACIWVAAWADWSTNTSVSNGNSLLEMYDGMKDSVDSFAKQPGCFYDYVKEWGLNGWKENKKYRKFNYKSVVEVDKGLILGYTSKWFYPQDLVDLLGGGAEAYGGVSREAFLAQSESDAEVGKFSSYSWLMDASCKLVTNKKDRPLCGFAGASWSPISLIWEDGYSIKKDTRVVEFPLSQNPEEKFALWQASAKAPLLVYDPKHTKAVTSAKQLFGNFAFGGVTTDPADSQKPEFRTAWDNGFHALALLDADKNGKLQGDELGSLSLWFDENQDARVDAGELRSLAEEKVVTLFVNGAKKTGDGDFTLDVGYEREVVSNNMISRVTGKSVDWFAHVFTSAKEAADTLLSVGKAAKSDITPEVREAFNTNPQPMEEWMKQPGQFSPQRPEQVAKDVTGYWMWWSDEDKNSVKHPGILALKQGVKGRVTGFSVVESVLKPNDMGARNVIQTIPAVGKAVADSKGMKVSFSVLDEFGNVAAVSSGNVSGDGMEIRGATEQQSQYEKEGAIQTAKVTYTWTARRMFEKDVANPEL